MIQLSEELASRLLQESGQGYVVTDPEGNIEEVSPRILQLTGYTKRDLIGGNPRIFKGGNTPVGTYRELWSNISTGKVWRGALLNKRKDGTLFLDRETIMPIIGARGAVVRFAALHREATEEFDLRARAVRLERSLEEVGREQSVRESATSLIQLLPSQLEAGALALASSIEKRIPMGAGHAFRVSRLMDLIGVELALFDRYGKNQIRIGSLLHDIGNIGVPEAILLKRSELTAKEYEVVKTHPVLGFDILRHSIQDEVVLRIVRHHHERLDGSGYPDGVAGTEVPDYVRAFTVCDRFDTMTSPRPYRAALAPDDAFSLLIDDALLGRLDMSTVKALGSLWKAGALDEIVGIREAA